MAKQKRPYRPRRLPTKVTVDAPSGEGKRMQVKTVMRQKAVLLGLIENRGHIARACEQAGVTRETYYFYMQDPDFAGAVEALKEGLVDDYIEALNAVALDSKFFPAIKYYLDNHAQGRGFGKEVIAAQDAAKAAQTANVQINLTALPVEVLKQLKAAVVTGEKPTE
jgi:molybdenum-dependent DNA-binding transcriptional regulator ModE